MTPHSAMIALAGGGYLDVADPGIARIRIADIAASLAKTCRFVGHTPHHYSVAQHSVLVARLLAERGETVAVQRWGLMHDAAEAYLGDLATPVKRVLRRAGVSLYDELEANLLAAIATRFELPPEMPEAVVDADIDALVLEQHHLLGIVENLPDRLAGVPRAWLGPQTPEAAEAIFRNRFDDLFARGAAA